MLSPGCDASKAVWLYPKEYLTYGLGDIHNLTHKPLFGKQYAITDHLGSTRLKINSSGTIITQSDYEPFGAEMLVGGVPYSGRKGFIDKETDTESKLGDFSARKYSDDIGRFLSVDILWEDFRGMNPYHYSRNSPIRLRDPSGLADYVGSDGNVIANDGNDDNRRFLTRQGIIDSNTTNGSTNWQSVQSTRGTELLPGRDVRAAITEHVIEPTEQISNRQEHGGAIFLDPTDTERFQTAESGPVIQGSDAQASINLGPVVRFANNNNGALRTVHSHPNLKGYEQTPSQEDLVAQGQLEQGNQVSNSAILISVKYNSRLGSNGVVHFYDSQGITATIKLSEFRVEQP